MPKFIVDAGPFIHLHQIDQLRILKKLAMLLVPASVVSEIGGDNTSRRIRNIKKWPNIHIISVRKPPTNSMSAIVDKASLQPGETDCIHLALASHPCIFLTDDLSARTTAEKLSIEVHGTIGIIAYAFRRKWLSIKKAEQSLDLLYHRSSLFITYAIIEDVIRRLKDSV